MNAKHNTKDTINIMPNLEFSTLEILMFNCLYQSKGGSIFFLAFSCVLLSKHKKNQRGPFVFFLSCILLSKQKSSKHYINSWDSLRKKRGIYYTIYSTGYLLRKRKWQIPQKYFLKIKFHVSSFYQNRVIKQTWTPCSYINLTNIIIPN